MSGDFLNCTYGVLTCISFICISMTLFAVIYIFISLLPIFHEIANVHRYSDNFIYKHVGKKRTLFIYKHVKNMTLYHSNKLHVADIIKRYAVEH